MFDELFARYDFMYLGKNSKDSKEKFFFKWDKAPDRNEYLERVNKHDSTADFIIVSVENIDELYSSLESVSCLPGSSRYMVDLFEGKRISSS